MFSSTYQRTAEKIITTAVIIMIIIKAEVTNGKRFRKKIENRLQALFHVQI